MGGAVISKENFHSALDQARSGGDHISYDVSLGRDFTDKTEQARDPKCVWARLNDQPVARIRLGRSVIVTDLITLYSEDGMETSHEVTENQKTGRLEMERRTLRAVSPEEQHPSFSGLKMYYGSRKWMLKPVTADRRGHTIREALFLVHEGSSKMPSDPKHIVGFVKVEDFAVTEFLMSTRFPPILVASVLYMLTRVCNGVMTLPNEKSISGGSSRPRLSKSQ